MSGDMPPLIDAISNVDGRSNEEEDMDKNTTKLLDHPSTKKLHLDEHLGFIGKNISNILSAL